MGCFMCVVDLTSVSVHARSSGLETVNCGGCHQAEPAELSVALGPTEPQPGQWVQIRVVIKSEGIAGAGMAFFAPEGGTFEVDESDPLFVSSASVVHTRPKPVSDGQVEFKLRWRTPETVGPGLFEVSVLAANGDGRNTGDWSADVVLPFGVGCTLETLYWDADRDGFGRDDSSFVSCNLFADYSPLASDCDDETKTTFPGAPELCNQIDDDCDGIVDEDLQNNAYYADADGDGFGDPGTRLDACVAPVGYVTNAQDCHDGTVAANPIAPEVCDYMDNDCDGEVDEGVRPTCGIGACKRESEACIEGALCTPGDPVAESCNGLDDDCNGDVDEVDPRADDAPGEGETNICAAGERCLDARCVPIDELPGEPTIGGVSAPLPNADATSAASSVSPESSGYLDTNSGAPRAPVGQPGDVEAAKPPDGCSVTFSHQTASGWTAAAYSLLAFAGWRRRASRVGESRPSACAYPFTQGDDGKNTGCANARPQASTDLG